MLIKTVHCLFRALTILTPHNHTNKATIIVVFIITTVHNTFSVLSTDIYIIKRFSYLY